MSLTRVKCDYCDRKVLVGNAILSHTKGHTSEYGTELRDGPYICKNCKKTRGN